tara:strand:- start:794 stop:1270 length:477 start_codon:yes stop_codon:yes gene_type:complete
MAPKTSKRPVTREDAKRLAAKRKRVSESPGMTKRMNVSGATGNKGSRYGAEETANMMATDSARGGVDPREERAKKKSKGNFDFMLKNSKGGKIAKKKAGGSVAKKKAGGAVTKKMGGGKIMKKGYAKGGKLAKMSKGGRGTIARGSGAARPQRFRKNG